MEDKNKTDVSDKGFAETEATEEEKTETVNEYIDDVDYLYEDETDRDSFRKRHKALLGVKAFLLGILGFTVFAACFGAYQTAQYGHWTDPDTGKTAFMMVYPNSQKAVKVMKTVHSISTKAQNLADEKGLSGKTATFSETAKECQNLLANFESEWASAGTGFEYSIGTDENNVSTFNFSCDLDKLISGSENLKDAVESYLASFTDNMNTCYISKVFQGSVSSTGCSFTAADIIAAYGTETVAYNNTMRSIFGLEL